VTQTKSPGSGSKTFLVERYVPGLTKDQFTAADRGIRRAVRDLVQTGAAIRLVSSTFIPAEEVVLSVFEACAQEAVIEANLRGGVRFDRIQSVELSGDEGPD
jgi:hypothetical protein